MEKKIRNIAIIAHVDHGKTTLVDALLKQGQAFTAREVVAERAMDSMDLEREKGITIRAKNAAIKWNEYKINIIDTPGHADFGGEVERVLRMADSVLLLVDAKEGPMPQTRFVLKKALALGLRPIVVINKIDRPDADPKETLDKTFNLFIELGASNEQLDFPIVYAAGAKGIASLSLETPGTDLAPLFETIIKHTPEPKGDPTAPFQMLVLNLTYDNYKGRIAIGKIDNGKVKAGEMVVLMKKDGTRVNARATSLLVFNGMERMEIDEVMAGDIVALAGFENVEIGETLADRENPVALPVLEVDEPTVEITFLPNDSPLSGREGKFTTSRQIRERLVRELETNVSLRMKEAENGGSFQVSGRGELQLAILLEQMRREGYEVAVSRPEVIFKVVDGKKYEPFEMLTVEVAAEHSGTVIDTVGRRKGLMETMVSLPSDEQHFEFIIPTRGVMGLRSALTIQTRGTAQVYHTFLKYDKAVEGLEIQTHGSMISMENGKAVAYALWNLQERGVIFTQPGEDVYVGMVIGEAAQGYDMEVNPVKEKKLTNVRSKAADDAIELIPPRSFTIESALEYLGSDELLEVTPKSLRMRKRYLDPSKRKRTN